MTENIYKFGDVFFGPLNNAETVNQPPGTPYTHTYVDTHTLTSKQHFNSVSPQPAVLRYKTNFSRLDF